MILVILFFWLWSCFVLDVLVLSYLVRLRLFLVVLCMKMCYCSFPIVLSCLVSCCSLLSFWWCINVASLFVFSDVVFSSTCVMLFVFVLSFLLRSRLRLSRLILSSDVLCRSYSPILILFLRVLLSLFPSPCLRLYLLLGLYVLVLSYPVLFRLLFGRVVHENLFFFPVLVSYLVWFRLVGICCFGDVLLLPLVVWNRTAFRNYKCEPFLMLLQSLSTTKRL